MATFTKTNLSASVNGKQIKVSASATAGTLIHTAVSGTSDWDEIWIYATNSHTSSLLLTTEWGEATVPDGNISVTIPNQEGLVLVIPGLVLQNGLEVRAFAATASKILLSGFVNRISA